MSYCLQGGIGMKSHKRKPVGLYVHIPFCVKKCAYCDFLSFPCEEQDKKSYMEALLLEIESYREQVKEYTLETVYIGGGTPSVMEEADIVKVLEKIQDIFPSTKAVLLEDTCLPMQNSKTWAKEITIEVNPGTLSKEKLEAYYRAGVRRLSMGLQSTNNQELERLGRIHTFETFLKNYHMARACGFSNINVDLMAALPEQTLESYLFTLKKVIALQPEHISAYSLIIEEGTAFYEQYGPNGSLNHVLPSEELEREMYDKTQEILEAAGYIRYEISNYAKKGYEAKHNCAYWKRIDYIGVGLGASSCFEKERYQNVEDFAEYLSYAADIKQRRRNVQKLEQEQEMEEFMFLGLRMTEGIAKKEFEQQFHCKLEQVYGAVIRQLEQEKLLESDAENVWLTKRGIDLSNYALAEFLFS